MIREITLRKFACDFCNFPIGQTTSPSNEDKHETIPGSKWIKVTVDDADGYFGMQYYYRLTNQQYNPICMCRQCHDVLEKSNDIWLTVALMNGW
jgi:hypothetical protein